MTTEPVFGSSDRYYASEYHDAGRLDDSESKGLEKKLAETLLKRYPDLNKTVERTYRRWNLTVREILRTETGLRLSVGESRQAVQVRVIDGLPRPFHRILTQAPDQINWDLALHQSLLTETQSGLEYIRGRLAPLAALVEIPEKPDHELAVSLGLVERLVEEARSFNLLKAIMEIEEDVLGAYFFRPSSISLYWLPIGIVASLLGVSIEALTVVVLAHELAHAYTHLGLDIDGQAWKEWDFAFSDIRIVEGLAQFYARAVCMKIAGDYPAASEAFSALLNEQSPAYWSCFHWIEDVEAPGELIRYCLIRTRTQSIQDYASFQYEVEQGKQHLLTGNNDRRKHGRSF